MQEVQGLARNRFVRGLQPYVCSKVLKDGKVCGGKLHFMNGHFICEKCCRTVAEDVCFAFEIEIREVRNK